MSIRVKTLDEAVAEARRFIASAEIAMRCAGHCSSPHKSFAARGETTACISGRLSGPTVILKKRLAHARNACFNRVTGTHGTPPNRRPAEQGQGD